MFACPTCGTGVPDGAKFCASCGRTLTAPAPVPAVLPTQQQQTEYVADPEWYDEEDESEARSPIIPAILGALAAIILVASVGGFVLLKGKGDPSPTTPLTNAATGTSNSPSTSTGGAPATTGTSAPTVAGSRVGSFAGSVTFPNFTVSILSNSTAGIGPTGQVLDVQVKACLIKPVSGTSTPMSRSAWRARLANGSTIAADTAYNDAGAYATRKVISQGECSEGVVRFKAPAGSGGVVRIVYSNASGNTHTFAPK